MHACFDISCVCWGETKRACFVYLYSVSCFDLDVAKKNVHFMHMIISGKD